MTLRERYDALAIDRAMVIYNFDDTFPIYAGRAELATWYEARIAAHAARERACAMAARYLNTMLDAYADVNATLACERAAENARLRNIAGCRPQPHWRRATTHLEAHYRRLERAQ